MVSAARGKGSSLRRQLGWIEAPLGRLFRSRDTGDIGLARRLTPSWRHCLLVSLSLGRLRWDGGTTRVGPDSPSRPSNVHFSHTSKPCSQNSASFTSTTTISTRRGEVNGVAKVQGGRGRQRPTHSKRRSWGKRQNATEGWALTQSGKFRGRPCCLMHLTRGLERLLGEQDVDCP